MNLLPREPADKSIAHCPYATPTPTVKICMHERCHTTHCLHYDAARLQLPQLSRSMETAKTTYIVLDVSHCVKDGCAFRFEAYRLTICPSGACRVYVQVHGLRRVGVLEIQELCYDQLCDCRDQWHSEVDDPGV
jgi:hypothetical protein